jgi:tetratricopeptide (TPR) repeat protein
LYANFSRVDIHREFWPHDYARDMAKTLPDGAVYLTEGDHHPFFSVYLKVVEKSIEDVKVLEAGANVFEGYGRLEGLLRYGNYGSVYCSQEAELDPFPGVEIDQTGVLNRWVVSPGDAPDPVKYYTFRADREDARSSGYMSRSIYANYKYHMARRLVNMGRASEAKRYLDDALYVGDIFPWLIMNIGNIERTWGLRGSAMQRYEQVLRIAPARYEAHLNIGDMMIESGDMPRARDSFLEALTIKSARSDPYIYMRLAEINEALGEKEDAEYYREKYKRISKSFQ